MLDVTDDLWEELENRWDELEPQPRKVEEDPDSPEAGSPRAETSSGGSDSLTTTREQFIIEVGSKYEAECVARELDDRGSDLQHRDGKWVVAVTQPELLELPALLAALDKCLHDNAISSVRIVIGERSYVMEPAAG